MSFPIWRPSFRYVLQSLQLVLDVLQRGDLRLRLGEVEPACVVRVELVYHGSLGVALGEVLVVVQAAVVSRDAVEVAHVLCLRALLLGQECLVHLLPVPDAYHPDVLLPAAEELAHRLGLCLYGAGRGLLHEDVAVLPVLEREQYKVHRLLKAHDEARHPRLGHRYGMAATDLLYPQGDHAAARAHHIAVPRAADLRVARVTALCHRNLLLDRLGDAHRVDRVRRLVRRQADHALHAVLDGCRQNIVRAYHIRLHRLHREELAARDLLQRRRVEDVVCPGHRAPAALQAPHVPDVELDLVRDIRVLRLVLVPHVVLLLLVPREDPDLRYVGPQKTVQDCVPKTAGTAGDHQCLSCKNAHVCMFLILLSFVVSCLYQPCFSRSPSVPPEDVPRVDLTFHIVEARVVAVRDDRLALPLEFREVVDDLTPEESAPILESWLVDYDFCAFCLDALHDALYAALTEVVAARLHRKTVYTYDAFLLFLGIEVPLVIVVIVPSHMQHPVRDEVLPRTVGIDYCLDQVLRDVVVVRQQLLRVLRKAVAPVTERRVVVVAPDPRVEAHPLDDGLRVEALHLRVGVQLVEVAHPQGKIGVREKLHRLRLSRAHVQHGDIPLE